VLGSSVSLSATLYRPGCNAGVFSFRALWEGRTARKPPFERFFSSYNRRLSPMTIQFLGAAAMVAPEGENAKSGSNPAFFSPEDIPVILV